MTKQTIAIIIAILAIAGLGAIFLLNQDEPETGETPQVTEQSQTTSGSSSESSSDTFTATQVATHNTEDDCWTIIDGNVYDITSYIPRHPGGDEILRACGEDGSSLFNQRQTSDGESVGSGTPHSSSATSQLESLKTGVLEN